MTSHSLAIAKASLAAGMMRPDPSSISRTEIARFHNLLEASLRQCSTTNIQLCKDWLLENIVPSTSRVAAVGKYLAALSESITNATDDARPQLTIATNIPNRRKQLHMLYLLNDLFHHTKYHLNGSSAHSNLIGQLESHLNDLFGFTSAHSIEIHAKHNKKIQNLLDIWDSNSYYPSSYIEKLRNTAATAARFGHQDIIESSINTNVAQVDSNGKDREDAPYIMPASHGDSSTPFYDLPAANMLPHILPNSSAPITPHLLKPIQFTAGPAPDDIITTVKEFLRDVGALKGAGPKDEEHTMDIDELGQLVIRDEITGDILEGDGYYGWSKAFCERMKRRGASNGDVYDIGDRDPRNRYYTERKRSKSRSRVGSSPSSLGSGRNMRRSRQPSSRRTRSESRRSSGIRRSRSSSRSCSYSPPPVAANDQKTLPSVDPRPLPRDRAQGRSPLQVPPFVHPLSQGLPPIGPGSLPIPPPPPSPPAALGSNDSAHPHMLPSVPPTPEPPMYQAIEPSFSQGLPVSSFGQASQTFNDWKQQQQQHRRGLGSNHMYSTHGPGQLPFNDRGITGRGRGYGAQG